MPNNVLSVTTRESRIMTKHSNWNKSVDSDLVFFLPLGAFIFLCLCLCIFCLFVSVDSGRDFPFPAIGRFPVCGHVAPRIRCGVPAHPKKISNVGEVVFVFVFLHLYFYVSTWLLASVVVCPRIPKWENGFLMGADYGKNLVIVSNGLHYTSSFSFFRKLKAQN